MIMKKNILILFLFLALGVAVFFVVTFKLGNDDLKAQEKTLLQKITTISLNNDMLEKDLDRSMMDFTQAQKKIREGEGRYEIIDNSCSLEQCLVRSAKTTASTTEFWGLAQIEGYYQSIEREAWGETKKCDSFVVTGGSQVFRDFMQNLVKIGNTVNLLDENKNVVINIDVSKLSQIDKTKILNSKESKFVKLSILKPTLEAHGAPVCYSFVEILNVK